MITIKATTQKHVDFLKDNLRPIDQYECRAMGLEPDEALQLSFQISVITMTALVDGKPFCIFGATAASYINSIGILWLLSSKELDNKKVAIQCGLTSIRCMRFLLEYFNTLINNVSSNNKQALKWLKWLGAEIEESKPMGLKGERFNKITIKKENVR